MKVKNNFLLSDEWKSMFCDLPDEKAGQLIKAAFCYHTGDDFSIDDPVLSAVFSLIREQIDKNEKRYKEVCERNAENISKRWNTSENGRIRKDTKANDRIRQDTNKNDEIPVDTDNDNDSDNEKHKNILPDKSGDEHLMVAVGAIIDHLNEKAKTKYRRSSRTTIQLIRARMEEKFTVEDFKTVIDKKCDEWLGTEMEKHLNPETLFRPSHFETYLNQKIIKPKSKTTAFHNFPQRSDPENHRLAQLIASSAQNRI